MIGEWLSEGRAPGRLVLAAGAALALGIVTAAEQAAAEGELHVYNWGDYINPAVLDKFSEAHDVKVTLDTYGSNEEMLAKIQAGAAGYDIVFPSRRRPVRRSRCSTTCAR